MHRRSWRWRKWKRFMKSHTEYTSMSISINNTWVRFRVYSDSKACLFYKIMSRMSLAFGDVGVDKSQWFYKGLSFSGLCGLFDVLAYDGSSLISFDCYCLIYVFLSNYLQVELWLGYTGRLYQKLLVCIWPLLEFLLL